MQLRTSDFSGQCTELPDVLRQLAADSATGWLYLGADAWHASIFLALGRVRSACFESLDGLEALEHLGNVLPEGEYVFDVNRPAPPGATFDLDVEELLRLLSPRLTPASLNGDFFNAIPQPMVPINGSMPGGDIHISRAMLTTFRAVDGVRTVRHIIDVRKSPATVDHLKRLQEFGLIGFETGASASPTMALATLEPPAKAATAATVAVRASVCPLLGLQTAPGEYLERPSSAHSCFASGRAVSLALTQQRSVCLTPSFETCPLLASANVSKAADVPSISGRNAKVPAASVPGSPSRTARNSRRGPTTVLGAALALGIVAILAVGALLVSKRLPVPSPAPTPSPIVVVAATVAPTLLPTIEPTTLPTPSAVRQLANPRTALDETFANNSTGWRSDPNGPALLQPGVYHMRTATAGQFVAIGIPHTEVYGDATVRVSFSKSGGPAGGGFGIILRDQGPGPRDGVNQGGRYYVFEIGDKGQIGAWRREADHWVDMLPWTDSDAVRAGQASNDLEVRASGGQFTIRVNGVDVNTLNDATLAYGGIGLFVGGDQNEVLVQHLTVLAPDDRS